MHATRLRCLRYLARLEPQFHLPPRWVQGFNCPPLLLEEIQGPEQIIQLTGPVLTKIIAYWKQHNDPDADPEALKAFNEDFVKVERDEMYELITVANYLNSPPLLDLLCQDVTDTIKNMSVEECCHLCLDALSKPRKKSDNKLLEPKLAFPALFISFFCRFSSLSSDSSPTPSIQIVADLAIHCLRCCLSRAEEIDLGALSTSKQRRPIRYRSANVDAHIFFGDDSN